MLRHFFDPQELLQLSMVTLIVFGGSGFLCFGFRLHRFWRAKLSLGTNGPLSLTSSRLDDHVLEALTGLPLDLSCLTFYVSL